MYLQAQPQHPAKPICMKDWAREPWSASLSVRPSPLPRHCTRTRRSSRLGYKRVYFLGFLTHVICFVCLSHLTVAASHANSILFSTARPNAHVTSPPSSLDACPTPFTLGPTLDPRDFVGHPDSRVTAKPACATHSPNSVTYPCYRCLLFSAFPGFVGLTSVAVCVCSCTIL